MIYGKLPATAQKQPAPRIMGRLVCLWGPWRGPRSTAVTESWCNVNVIVDVTVVDGTNLVRAGSANLGDTMWTAAFQFIYLFF